jgi:hypothetical protein
MTSSSADSQKPSIAMKKLENEKTGETGVA